MEEVKLDENMLKNFKPALIFKHNKTTVNSLDMSRDGRFLVTLADDGVLNYYDLERGEKINTYTVSPENKAREVKFSNHNKAVLVVTKDASSTNILYWSLHDNVILAKFSSGKADITTIDVNPLNSTFVACSDNGEARVWDYDKVDAIALFTECQAACIDNRGTVLALSHCPKDDENLVYLYNMAEELYDKPFCHLKTDLSSSSSHIKFMKFSYNGKYVLCVDSLNNTLIVDAFKGGCLARLDNNNSDPSSSHLVADFTPYSEYVLMAFNKTVVFWDWENHKEISLSREHVKNINAVKFNTDYCMVASACQNVIIWIPDLENNMAD